MSKWVSMGMGEKELYCFVEVHWYAIPEQVQSYTPHPATRATILTPPAIKKTGHKASFAPWPEII